MHYILHSTDVFDKWFGKLRDATVKRKILARLARLENGNPGDCKQIAPDLYELRLFFSGGLRLYYTISGASIILLLTGGDKSSQEKDVAKAEKLLQELKQVKP